MLDIIKDPFKATYRAPTKQGAAGYDNPRENIDPHLKTQAFSASEMVCKTGVFLGNVTALNLTGNNTGDQDLSGLVPYTSATTDVDSRRATNSNVGTALAINCSINAGAGVIGSTSALYGFLDVLNGQTGNITGSLNGLNYTARLAGQCNATTLIVVNATTQLSATAAHTFSNASYSNLSQWADYTTTTTNTLPHHAAYASVDSTIGNATITNKYGLWLHHATSGGAGTIINHYGIKIDDIAYGTNKWAIKTGTGLVELGDDIIFTGSGSGLSYGEISAHDNATATTLAAQDTFYQVTIFDTDGVSNLTTPDHTNDHITVSLAGVYKVECTISSSSANSNSYDYHVKINNGATQFLNLTTHRNTSVANGLGACTISGLVTLSANDTVELWIQRSDGGAVSKSITINAVTLSLFQVGG